jgi:hypothetical protein
MGCTTCSTSISKKIAVFHEIAIPPNNPQRPCIHKTATHLFAFLPSVPNRPPAAATPLFKFQRLVHQKQQSQRVHTLKKWLKMGTYKHPQPLQVPQTLAKHQRQQIQPEVTHTSPKIPRNQPPSTWCTSAHRNGLLFLWAAGGRCKCGSLSKPS